LRYQLLHWQAWFLVLPWLWLFEAALGALQETLKNFTPFMRGGKPVQSVLLLTFACLFNPSVNLYTTVLIFCLLQIITRLNFGQPNGNLAP